MSSIDPTIHARQLSDAWDRLLKGDSVPGDLPELELIDQLSRSEAEGDLPAELQSRIWNDVMRETARQLSPTIGTTPIARTSSESRPNILVSRLTALAWIVVAGMAGGFIAGIGSRLFMRLAGFLTVDQNRSLLTENDAAVGEITLDGTLSLGFMGAGAGIFALLVYVAIRDRLPFDGWRRSASFSVLLLLVFGYVIMDPSNPDYQTFGPTWLNVSTFSSLYLIMGFATAEIYELGRRRSDWFAGLRNHRIIRFPIFAVSGFLCLIALFLAPIILIVGATGLIVVAVAGVAWLASRYLSLDRFLAYRVPAFVRPWGMLVVPGIVGFILTARGVTEILLNR